jgi:hypothetical protein
VRGAMLSNARLRLLTTSHTVLSHTFVTGSGGQAHRGTVNNIKHSKTPLSKEEL